MYSGGIGGFDRRKAGWIAEREPILCRKNFNIFKWDFPTYFLLFISRILSCFLVGFSKDENEKRGRNIMRNIAKRGKPP